MISPMESSEPIFSEVQLYRELPPFTLLVVVGALFGWFLVIWVVALGRPLGALALPPWLALAIGLPLGILLPLAFARLRMVTSVFADRVEVINGMSSRAVFRLVDVADVEVRTDDIRDDYNIRNVGAVRTTRIAYTVTTTNGVQLMLADGRYFLIGSKQPAALGAAIAGVWQAVRPEAAVEVAL